MNNIRYEIVSITKRNCPPIYYGQKTNAWAGPSQKRPVQCLLRKKQRAKKHKISYEVKLVKRKGKVRWLCIERTTGSIITESEFEDEALGEDIDLEDTMTLLKEYVDVVETDLDKMLI